MLADPRVRKLSFTGSTEVGRVLLRTAAETVTNCSMELGGNAPFLVFEDADIDAAIEGAFLAKMRNGGEACTAANRFYVHDAVADEFTAKFAARLEKLSVGPGLEEGTDLGPLVNEDTRSKVATLVAEAADDRRPGGHRRPRPGPPRLLLPAHRPGRVPPTLGHPGTRRSSARWRPSCGSPTRRKRSAGPTTPSTAWSPTSTPRDLRRALRVAEALETGMVGINRGIVSDPAAPFGGVKQSGLGREGGHDGLLEFTETKYIAVDW